MSIDLYPETRTTVSELPATLRRLRKMRGLTLKEAAAGSGLSFSYISDIEQGRTQPPLRTIQRLAEVYRVPIAVYFPGESDDPTVSAITLLPCPFCHSTDLSTTVTSEWRAFVACGVCLAAGPVVSSDVSEGEARGLAGVLWNQRDKA